MFNLHERFLCVGQGARKLKDDPLHDSADVQFYIVHHENKIFNSFKFFI